MLVHLMPAHFSRHHYEESIFVRSKYIFLEENHRPYTYLMHILFTGLYLLTHLYTSNCNFHKKFETILYCASAFNTNRCQTWMDLAKLNYLRTFGDRRHYKACTCVSPATQKYSRRSTTSGCALRTADERENHSHTFTKAKLFTYRLEARLSNSWEECDGRNIPRQVCNST